MLSIINPFLSKTPSIHTGDRMELGKLDTDMQNSESRLTAIYKSI